MTGEHVTRRVLVSASLAVALILGVSAGAYAYDQLAYRYDHSPTIAAAASESVHELTSRPTTPASGAFRLNHDSPPSSVATNTARSGSQLVDDSLQGLQAGRSSGVRVVDSADELDDLFRQLSVDGTPVSGKTYPGKMVELPDGTTVGVRTTSVSGGPTIDIKLPDGTRMKVHVSQ